MTAVMVDSNVILDIATEDLRWLDWSMHALQEAAERAILVINPLIYAEVSVGFQTIEGLEQALPRELYTREPLPYEAAFLAGKSYLTYRRRGGKKTSPLPDFYIGAHAAVSGHDLLTRDATRFKTYFPTVRIIAPEPTG